MKYRLRPRGSRISVVALAAVAVGALGAGQFQSRPLPPLRLVSSPVITEYPQPNPPHSGAHRITVGPDGALWYTLPTSNEIGRLSTSGSASFFPVHGAPEDITLGPDGNLWFTEYLGFMIGRLTPSGTLTEFTLANPSYGDPDGIVAGPDGNLWFTYYQDPNNTTFQGQSHVGKISPAGTVTNYQLTNLYAGAMGIAAGPDGDIWVTENRQEAVDRITPSTGADQVILLGSAITGHPAEIVPGPGSTMWFSETATPQVGSISLDGQTVVAHALPPGESANGIAFDSSNNLWYADGATSSVGEMGPGGAVVETQTPTNGSSPYGMVADPSDHALWFTENAIPAVATLAQPNFTLLGAPLTLSELNGLFNGCHACLEQYLAKSGAKADPVNPVTGNFTESVNDISIPARGLPFGFTRTYNSANASNPGPLGHGWSMGYGASLAPPGGGASVTVTLDSGSTVPFMQQGSIYVPAAPREIAALVHNTDGSWTLTLQAREHITFNPTGQESSESDLNGYSTSLSYTGALLTQIKDAAMRTLTLTYTSGLLTKVNDDQTGRFISYAYNDGNGNLTDVTDVNGGNWHYGYDANHLLTTFRDARSNTTTNHYNAQNQVDWQKDPLLRLTQFAYTGSSLSPAGGTTTITDRKGNMEYDQYQSGVLVSQTKGYLTPQAATWTYQYDAATMAMTAETDPDGHVTRMQYDANGNVIATVDALGRWTTTTYNALNKPLTVTDPTRVTTTSTYDTNGNLTSTSRPLVGSSPLQTQTTTYYHDDSSHPGDVTRMVDPDGKTWTYAYDTYGDQQTSTDPLADQSSKSYNADGWLTASVSPKGNVSGCGCTATYTTTYSYADPTTGTIDKFGDVRVVTDPLGNKTTYSYDPDRNQVTVKDGMGHTTTSTFDLDNELTKTKRPDGTTVLTDYNPDGTVLDQKDGKANTILTFGYDPLARVTSQTDALSNTTQVTYDGAGNQLTKQDPGGNCSGTPATGCTTMGYDAANQLISVTYSDGVTPNVTGVSYDSDGERTGWTDGSGSWQQSFDSLHRLTAVTEGSSGTVSYQYNLRNLPTTITYPDTHAVTETYDDSGRWTKVTDWNGSATSIKYDANSNLTKETLPASTTVVDTYQYNPANGMTSVADVAGSTSTFSASYTYNSDSLLASDTAAPASQTKFKYTGLNQLCYAGSASSSGCTTPPVGAEPFVYDAADNLTQLNTQSQQYNNADELCWTINAPSSNACASRPSGATIYSYDTRGNGTSTVPASGAATCYAYDEANRLTNIKSGTGSSCTGSTSVGTYAYNMFGLRMSKSVGGSVTAEAWDLGGNQSLILEDKTGATTTDYVYGPGGVPLEQITGATTLWYGHDHLGSIRVITNASGAVQASYTYDPYGNLVSSTGSLGNQPFRFAGEYQDSESGLYYLRARYYNPISAQFLARDSEVPLTRSPYAYVLENPLNDRDPSGRGQYDKVVQCYSNTGVPDGLVVQTWDSDYGFVSGESCDTLNVAGGAVWGGNGENTDNAIVPADVNAGHYNDGPVVNAELGEKIEFTICDLAFEGALFYSGVGEAIAAGRVLEAAALAASSAFTYWDWTRR
jgi:RHS repeat-associated protein